MTALRETTRILGSAREEAGRSAADDLTGRLLSGRFLVRDVIGRGGTSTVYRGWHRDLHCPVAIKVLNASVAADRALNRYFLREAMVTARLSSPHAVRVYDRGLLEDGAPYTVMEYLEGETLEELLARVGRLPVTVAVELALQVCALLTEAHGQSIAHCDIKPDNLFLFRLPDRRSLLKVLDFGTARGKHTPDYVWQSCVGTPGYMAPEQIERPGDVDHRADIWALGVILYQMVSGSLPFAGLSPCERMAATLRRVPPPLEGRAPDLPRAYYDLVERCLTKEPAGRYPTVRALSAELRRVRRQLRYGSTGAEPHRMVSPARRVVRQAADFVRARSSTRSYWGRLGETLGETLRHARHGTLSPKGRLLGACLLLACLGAFLGTRVPTHLVERGTAWLFASSTVAARAYEAN